MLTVITAFWPVPRLALIWPLRCGGAFSATGRPARHVCWKVCAAVATSQLQYDDGRGMAVIVADASGCEPFAPNAMTREMVAIR